MSEDALWLDGNAIAALLIDVFGADRTASERWCQSCGARNRLGAHRVYRGAGTVMRCPVCGDIALRITSLPDRYVVSMAGTWTFDAPRAD